MKRILVNGLVLGIGALVVAPAVADTPSHVIVGGCYFVGTSSVASNGLETAVIELG